LSIWFHPRNHAPPHFHVIGPGTAVLVDLRDPQVIAGSYHRKDLRLALVWAAGDIWGGRVTSLRISVDGIFFV
jgi:hypothetical protein